jgi:hypothetical protein
MKKEAKKPGAPQRNVNALRHGLFAKSDLIEGESVEEYQRYVEAILEDERPNGAMELIIVQRIAGLCWRMERIPHLEAAAFACGIRDEEDFDAIQEKLDRVALYQSRLSRDVWRMRQELKMVREDRRQRALEKDPPQPVAVPPVRMRPRIKSLTPPPPPRPARQSRPASQRVTADQFFGFRSAEERQAEGEASAKAYLAKRAAEKQNEKTIQPEAN